MSGTPSASARPIPPERTGGKRDPSPGLPSLRAQAGLVAVVTLAAFAAYCLTLLPGFDFGDTAAFQWAGRDRSLTPRQAYPLYFAVGQLVVRLAGGQPAWGMNLASALAGAAACGALTAAGTLATGSLLGGAVAGLLLGASYTFWSQAVIAEVYTLHLLMMGLVLLGLLWWDRRPSVPRLTLVCLLYASSFGNHLMSILLAPALVVFVATRQEGWQAMKTPRVIALAFAWALAGASLYLWNFSHLWHRPVPPADLAEALRIFWFDVTKADWRESLVLGIHESAIPRRAGMYWFDLRQQVGVTGAVLALAGLAYASRRGWRLAALLLVAWLPAFLFAYTYNVGDVHVFFLPAHQITILAAGFGATGLHRLACRVRRVPVHLAAAVLVVAWPLARAWDTWPAVDRSADHRPEEWMRRFTSRLDHRAVLLADLNWQAQNGLDYFARHVRPELNVTTAADALLTLPFLVAANHAIGRDIFASPRSAAMVAAAYGEVLRFTMPDGGAVPPLGDRLADLPPGTRYVLSVLAPDPELEFNWAEIDAVVERLTGGTARLRRDASYTVLAGTIGAPPVLLRHDDRPFRQTASVGGLELDIRMESWLPTDTIRRAGFGHVIAGRRHLLIMERGASFLAISAGGDPLRVEYASSLFAPLPLLRLEVAPSPAL